MRSALQHKVGGDAIAGPPEDAVLDGERAAAVRAAMDELPDELRRVVELRDVTELSYAQIATILDIKEGTVGSRRHAALARLRTILAVALAAGVLATLTLRPEATPKPDPVRALLDGVDHPALVGWGRTELREPESIPTSDPTVKMYRVGG